VFYDIHITPRLRCVIPDGVKLYDIDKKLLQNTHAS